MKCEELSLCNLLESNNSKFIIPVYQRKYYWDSINCSQLYTDIVRLINNPLEKHFFGTIVLVGVDASKDEMIIDGQQRITTLSLFILAAIKAVKDGTFPDTDKTSLRRAFDNYIEAQYVSDDRKIKLQPLDEDCLAYDKIVRGEEDLIENSYITRNFKFFYNLFLKNRAVFSFEQILDAVDRLEVVAIKLGREDDAQLIFESINSTGVALNESDKIRNYMLMSVPQNKIEEYYSNYWKVIEQATKGKLEEFVRYYLTIKLNYVRPVNYGSLYLDWKKYMQLHNRIDVLQDMANFARLFKKIDQAQLSSDPEDKLSRKMSQINTLQSKVYYIFLMSFLEYAQSNNLSENEIFNVLDVLENYLARRAIVETKSNALTQVFCGLHKKILTTISILEKTDSSSDFSYSDVMIHHIVNLGSNSIMPRDVEFIQAIKTCRFYDKPKETKMFVFERLENARSGEINDVVADMSLNKASIEHIMPQKLSNSWKDMLGNDYKTIHKKYLHTLANLTLTGYNSSLGAKPFLEKRDGDSEDDESLGYRDSKYRITSQLTQYDKWTQEELDQRAEVITKTFLKLYPFPEDKLKSLSLQMDEYHLGDEIPLKKRKLDGFTLFGQEYEISAWKRFFTKTLQLLLESYSKKFDPLFNNEDCFLYHDNGEKETIELDSDHYVYCKNSIKEYIRILRTLFDSFEIDYTELVLKFKPEDQFSSLGENEHEISLAEDVDMTDAHVEAFYLFGQKYECANFTRAYQKIVEIFVQRYPKECTSLFSAQSNFYTKKKEGSEYIEVGENRFIRRATSAKEKWRLFRILFKHVGVDESQLVVIASKKKKGNT